MSIRKVANYMRIGQGTRYRADDSSDAIRRLAAALIGLIGLLGLAWSRDELAHLLGGGCESSYAVADELV